MPITNLIALFMICCTVFAVVLTRSVFRVSTKSKCPYCGNSLSLTVGK